MQRCCFVRQVGNLVSFLVEKHVRLAWILILDHAGRSLGHLTVITDVPSSSLRQVFTEGVVVSALRSLPDMDHNSIEVVPGPISNSTLLVGEKRAQIEHLWVAHLPSDFLSILIEALKGQNERQWARLWAKF